jgi:hypothetical protein
LAVPGHGVGLLRLTHSHVQFTSQGVREGLVAAGLLAIPWVLAGAMGSPLDALLSTLQGLSFGEARAYVCCGFLLPGIWTPARGSPREIILGGMASSVAILIMASQLGSTRHGRALELQLPVMGFLLAAVAYSAQNDEQPHASGLLVALLLMGLTAATVLALTDPLAAFRMLEEGAGQPLWPHHGVSRLPSRQDTCATSSRWPKRCKSPREPPAIVSDVGLAGDGESH